ncbi:MAG: PIN domain-containing protein [Burkholderiales bacterium]|nr:PIN domain-containing protein [Phycisphaerae bacterium]
MSSTTEKHFVDTNILVYAFSSSPGDFEVRARRLLREMPGLVISTQVLLEFANVAMNKASLPAASVLRILGLRRYVEVVVVEPHDIEVAVELRMTTSISLWDSLIVAAASKAGCSTLYTEDLNHGQIIRGVKVVNPFKKD